MSQARAHFEEAEVWDRPLTPWERRRIDVVAEHVPSGVRSILDVGCGDGRVTHVLAERGFEMTGLDGSATALARLRVPHKRGEVDAIDFPDDSFDLVLCTEVLEHLPGEVHEGCLRELARVARSYVLVTVPNEEPLAHAHTRCPACGEVFHCFGHVRSYTADQVAALLPGCELTVVTAKNVPTWSPLLFRLRTDVLRRYQYSPGAVCPRCENDDFSALERDVVRAVVGRVNALLMRGRTRPGGFTLGRFRV